MLLPACVDHIARSGTSSAQDTLRLRAGSTLQHAAAERCGRAQLDMAISRLRWCHINVECSTAATGNRLAVDTPRARVSPVHY